ncbi:hypothetical protein DAERI_040057 [Deinococcus aerius]|uniref:Uncharacterized protein n=1 Tax=Deinococcus aerius TaxID=200253 RepID=A0A2I9DS89_9DEIO|nr:hypothetical protein [Deinococcus aerius]GBF05297.1 hypothetical protein DAERI_040057 [Deinococcus aerius]
MKAEEWQKGMENEAASVEDEGWAAETRRSAWLVGARPLTHDFLLTAGASVLVNTYVLTMMVVIARAAFYMDQNPVGLWFAHHGWTFDLSLLGVLTLLGVFLGRLNVKPSVVAAVFLLQPLWLWLLAAAVRVEGVWNGPGASASAPFTTDFVRYELNWGSLMMAGGYAGTVLLAMWVRRRAAVKRRRTA